MLFARLYPGYSLAMGFRSQIIPQVQFCGGHSLTGTLRTTYHMERVQQHPEFCCTGPLAVTALL